LGESPVCRPELARLMNRVTRLGGVDEGIRRAR